MSNDILNFNSVTRLASWNVQTLNGIGEERMLLEAMNRYGISISALTEVKWPGKGERNWGEHRP